MRKTPIKPHRPGKFWPAVRVMIWEKAEELHAADTHIGFEGRVTKPTRQELREGGYFYQAKLMVLRQSLGLN